MIARTGKANVAARVLGRGVRSGVVEVWVLGPVEVFDGTSVVRLTRAERTVLAALAARVGERVPVDVLEEALWPQQRPS